MTADLSAVEARRIALSAQGFGRSLPAGRPGSAHVRRAASRLGAIQIDPINVLVRSHYIPVFSRIGPYSTSLFDRLAFKEGALFEYIGHAASYLPIELHPLVRWRMTGYWAKQWSETKASIERRRPGYVETVEREIAERGPLAFSDLTDQGKREKVPTKYADSSIAWWTWSDGKDVLEGLFGTGRLAVAGRRGAERLYDFSDRVIPEKVRAIRTPAEEDAKRALVGIAARALGVATLRDLADYFRLPVAETRARARELVEEGALRVVGVEGWKDKAYLHAEAKASPVEARALLSPFDSLIWERRRTERLFGFPYRIEIYVPEAKRQHGYYVLPFLLGDALVARADLKADRKRGTLLVPGAFAEPGHDARRTATELSEALRAVASWLSLGRIEVGERGDLSSRLAKAVRSAP